MTAHEYGPTPTTRPFVLTVQTESGHATWAGRRTRSFTTEAAATKAARKLAQTIATVNPVAAEVVIRDGLYGPVVARMDVVR